MARKGYGDLACVCCFEETCFGCEIAARANDPDYEEDRDNDYKDSDCEYEP